MDSTVDKGGDNTLQMEDVLQTIMNKLNEQDKLLQNISQQNQQLIKEYNRNTWKLHRDIVNVESGIKNSFSLFVIFAIIFGLWVYKKYFNDDKPLGQPLEEQENKQTV